MSLTLTDRTQLQFTGLFAVVAILLASAGYVILAPPGRTVTAYFTSAEAVFEDNAVRMLGIPVGTITKITPEGTQVRVDMVLDDPDIKVPADARAVVISPSLVTGRYVQLTPTYAGGPELADGAVIGVERTAVPLGVDDLARTATELSEALGPDGVNSDGALSQVLTNLIMNSLLHGFGDGDEQARRVRIAATAVGTDVAIQYADNGRGIDPEILPRIFDPFFTTRRGSGGSGLGMHIVRKLVHDTLGGTIAARSTPGDGAHFDLRLRDLATARPNETGEQAIGNG